MTAAKAAVPRVTATTGYDKNGDSSDHSAEADNTDKKDDSAHRTGFLSAFGLIRNYC
ncbi:hypothetical protein ABZ848_45490 [Streptomyces sp. NPDC047081]|uniref:hypothetical protein n=1 Tax=Streptomyces sp. NPDC047081 TaxID=3154706 RepID=UPI0034026E96